MDIESKPKRSLRVLMLLLACTALLPLPTLLGRSNGKAQEKPPAQTGSTDLFPAKAHLRYARGFTLEYDDTCKKIHILSPWRDARVSFTLLLVQRGEKMPSVPPSAVVVEIPLQRVALVSTTQVPFFAMLRLEGAIAGIARSRLVNTPEVAERIRRGLIEEIGVGNSRMVRNLNMERLFALQPDAVIVYGTGMPEFDLYSKLMEAGFPTLLDGAYMEPTPLGRAEWIKYVAAFFNRESDAERVFGEIAHQYEVQAARVKDLKDRPTVFHGMAYQNVWYMPGGDSYAARFYADAGAHYLWRDDSSRGNMPLSMEAVMERARDADFWVDLGPCGSLGELKGIDDRYSLFRAFRTGHVYNNDARIGPGGGNDYWEKGVARPDLVLADLISIFHPQAAPSHELVWYRRLPARPDSKP